MISITRGDLAAGLGDAALFAGTSPTLIPLFAVHLSIEEGRNGVLFKATDRFVLAERMVPARVDIAHDDDVCCDPQCGVTRTAATLIPLDRVRTILRDWKPTTAKDRRELRHHFDGTLTVTVAADSVTISGHPESDNRRDLITTKYDCEHPNLFVRFSPKWLDGEPRNPGDFFSIDPRKLAKFAATTFGKETSSVVRMSFGDRLFRVFMHGANHDSMDTFRGCVMLLRMAGEP